LSGSGSVLEALLAILLSDRLGVDVAGDSGAPAGEPSAAARVVREELQRRLGSGEAA
jgi:hypothetical protein